MCVKTSCDQGIVCWSMYIRVFKVPINEYEISSGNMNYNYYVSTFYIVGVSVNVSILILYFTF